jgi:hypothetical protein
MIMVGVNVPSGVMIIVMVIMRENRHPDVISAAATGGTHLGHLHTQQGELPTRRHLHISAAALAQQHKIVPPDIPTAAPAMQPASRLIDKKLGTFERGPVGRQLKRERQGVSQHT